jgi:hypothetical protein
VCLWMWLDAGVGAGVYVFVYAEHFFFYHMWMRVCVCTCVYRRHDSWIGDMMAAHPGVAVEIRTVQRRTHAHDAVTVSEDRSRRFDEASM